MTTFSLSHLVLPVRDVAAAQARYCEHFGFISEAPGLLSCGFFQVQLASDPNPPAQALGLECEDPEQIRLEGFTCLGPPEDQAGRRGVWWQDADGHRWLLWRWRNEDDEPLPPPLNTQRPWPPAAVALMQRLLKETPLNFRKSARKMAVLEAEWLAQGRELTEPDVVRGYIRAAPFPLRANLKAPLAKHGYDWRDFLSDFEAEAD